MDAAACLRLGECGIARLGRCHGRGARTYDGWVESIGAAIGALIPSIGVGLLFWWGMRGILRADRSEREALAQFESERDGVIVPAANAASRER